ncbi:MAG: B12-binding domain-containing radical SAM protein [Dehalococcoidia bacterium]|nr:B12-binding domain-containing radical SAM protein [Dehalococcoidia bacterium]
MKVLLVYPRYPETFWNMRHALKFISKKAAFTPLGLLTVASLLPGAWAKKLVDMNTDKLKDKDLEWADYVLISAMDIQKDSARDVIARCNSLGRKVVAGGPLFTTGHEDFTGVDHFVLGEGEVTVPRFLADLEKGCAAPVYQSDERPDISLSPVPMWELVDIKKYAAASLQYSRGCPHDCEFCDIVLLNGRVPRTKGAAQLIREMDAIYRLGWRDSLFVVDDNFIGNKNRLKTEILPAVVEWMKERHYPFALLTQVSVKLADDEELMRLMIQAGFDTVFVGVETPNEESLGECGKKQNIDRDLLETIKTMQNHGFLVHAGFIVGFDSDPKNIFERQISFIQKSGIAGAMVGLLKAPKGTKLYKRLKGEDRLTKEWSGDAVDLTTNFVPKMGSEKLVAGYKHIVSSTYAPRPYYARITTFLKAYRSSIHPRKAPVTASEVGALIKSAWYIGIREKGQHYYWRLMISTLFRRPRSFHMAVMLSIYGYHFRKVMAGHSRPAVSRA